MLNNRARSSHRISGATIWRNLYRCICVLSLMYTATIQADSIDRTLFISGGAVVLEGQLEAVGQIPGCSATLVGPQTVLTAAHCVCVGETTPTGCTDRSIFTFDNVFPVDNVLTPQDESMTRRNVSIGATVSVHPEYTSTGWLSHDFAVLSLDRPASDLVLDVEPIPVQLPPDSPKLGDHLTLVGYGRTGETCSSPPAGKRQITLPLREISTGNITLRIGVVGQGACPGDSGGPALSETGELVGVSSTSPGNYDPTFLALDFLEQFGVFGNPQLEVELSVRPAGDSSKFNILVDGATRAQRLGNGDSTGSLSLEPGTHRVTVSAVAPALLPNYRTFISGDCDPGGRIDLGISQTGSCRITLVANEQTTSACEDSCRDDQEMCKREGPPMSSAICANLFRICAASCN